MDTVSAVTRSRMMAAIRGRDTAPERLVRSALHRQGLRFRLHADLPGKPDLLFPKHGVALFVHGCFWHRHTNCPHAPTPATNIGFWQAKFAANVARDKRVRQLLRSQGWRVMTIWTCQISDGLLVRVANRIREAGQANTNRSRRGTK